MDNVAGTGASRGRWLIGAGFALLAVTMIVAAAVGAWQTSVHNSRSEEMESHTTTVALLEDVEEESGIAATLLQQYVAEGDDALIPSIQSHSDAALASLMQAAAQGDSEAIQEIAVAGAGLTEGAGQIIGLRLTGDVEGAAATLEAVSPAFEEFNLAFSGAMEQELQEASALQGEADEADDLATWSFTVAAAAGATMGFITLALGARSLIRRRASGPAVPA